MCAGRLVSWVAVSVLLVLLSHASRARAGLAILSHDVFVDEANRQTTFSITFDLSPDFRTVTRDGNPLHGFQYFYDAEPGGFEFAGEDVRVIRGVEIRFDDSIPVRESLNETGEEFPNAEGWGRSRGESPFALEDNAISFTVPWTVLGDEDGDFTYILLAFENGALTDEKVFRGPGTIIPLPPAGWAAPVSLAMAAGIRAVRSAISCATGAHRGSRASATRAPSTPPSAR
jgi:hypothetical protein